MGVFFSEFRQISSIKARQTESVNGMHSIRERIERIC